MVRELTSGNFFGEIALINNSVRTATTKSASYSTVANIERESVYDMFEKFPALHDTLKDHMTSYQDEFKQY